MFEELFNLLCKLGLGSAAKPTCDLVARLGGESMSLQQLQQEVRNVLTHHGRAHLTATVISALVELGLADFRETDESSGDAAPADPPRPGSSPIGDSVLLAQIGAVIAVHPRAVKDMTDIARGWLDIDGGICVDVSQHEAGSDSEK